MKRTPLFHYKKILIDLETPVSGFLNLITDESYACLLESVEGGKNRGRYSVIAMYPDALFKVVDNQVYVTSAEEQPFRKIKTPPHIALKKWLKKYRIPNLEGLPPMIMGLYGYIGYEAINWVEDLPQPKASKAICYPDTFLFRPQELVIFDAVDSSAYVVAILYPEHESFHKPYAQSLLEKHVNEIIRKLRAPLSHRTPKIPGGHEGSQQQISLAEHSHTSHDTFLENVYKTKEYLLDGDIFQAVLSQRFCLPFRKRDKTFEFYRHLRQINPAPFLFYYKLEDLYLIGSSPEILVRVREGKVTIRPIAGTRPRGKNTAEDNKLKQDLIQDPKERAEHLMLLDLARNDIGRIAKPGSIDVVAEFEIELYSHVMHIVSEVQGTLDRKYDIIDALFAGFPAGTVSGAPKVRAMEIIHELEPEKRGVYGGAIGYFGFNGDMDTCIALRTAVIHNQEIHIQAGAGIVADSDPESEYQETINKAKALFTAYERIHREETEE